MKDLAVLAIFILGSLIMTGSLVKSYDKTTQGVQSYATEIAKKF